MNLKNINDKSDAVDLDDVPYSLDMSMSEIAEVLNNLEPGAGDESNNLDDIMNHNDDIHHEDVLSDSNEFIVNKDSEPFGDVDSDVMHISSSVVFQNHDDQTLDQVDYSLFTL